VRDAAAAPGIDVVQAAELREKDFREAEGLKYGVRDAGGEMARALATAETREEMMVRAERFIEVYLEPVFAAINPQSPATETVVVVSHGLFLNILLRALLARYSPPHAPGPGGSGGGQYLASWSNTGYLEATVRKPLPIPGVPRSGRPQITVVGTNCVDHLKGLKKTRGGIGSSTFDAKQKTVDSFFGKASK
jgi:2,3-bisphosphoglycerate-dependent phosphoglycerate mutase